MKPLSFFVLFILALSTSRASAQFTRAELQVGGLTCSMCQLSTQKALEKLPFISEIKPDLKRNLFVLSFRKDAPVDLEQIRKKVQGAGFSVNKLVASFRFSNVAVKNDFHYSYGGTLYHFIDVPEKTLNGEVALSVISKDFIPGADYKRYSAKTTYPCYKSGTMGKDRVVHVTL